MDELADKLGIDRLEFRHRNALRAGDTTATGQMLDAFAPASPQCLEALRPHWQQARAEAAALQRRGGAAAARRRHRLHVVRHRQHRRCPTPRACGSAWRADGTLTLYNGARRYRPGHATPS